MMQHGTFEVASATASAGSSKRKGNIDGSALIWTMHSAGADWTVLKFDLSLRLGMPAPQSLIDEQLRDSAMDAVNSIHDRAQGSKDIVPHAG
jgi:hypothetical protein